VSKSGVTVRRVGAGTIAVPRRTGGTNVPSFAALIYEPKDSRRAPTDADFAEYMGGYGRFGEQYGASLTGGAALLTPETATTVHVEGGEEGDVVMVDGPYAETKEFLGGFYLIQAEDLDAAVAIARHIPAAWRDGGRVEVRPVWEM
jgi:hypothetical protein